MNEVSDNRPPSFLSKATLARELDCAESTIDELVKRGLLPAPLKITSGVVRWRWDDVEKALAAIKGGPLRDPGFEGVDRYFEKQKQKGHDKKGKGTRHS